MGNEVSSPRAPPADLSDIDDAVERFHAAIRSGSVEAIREQLAALKAQHSLSLPDILTGTAADIFHPLVVLAERHRRFLDAEENDDVAEDDGKKDLIFQDVKAAYEALLPPPRSLFQRGLSEETRFTALTKCATARRESPLHAAARTGATALCELLLRESCCGELCASLNGKFEVPLVVAARKAHRDCFSLLLPRTLKHVDDVLDKPRLVMSQGSHETREVLLVSILWRLAFLMGVAPEEMARPVAGPFRRESSVNNSQSSTETTNSIDTDWRHVSSKTPAVSSDSSALREMAMEIIKSGSQKLEVSTGGRRGVLTPLHVAVRTMDAEMVQLLLQQGANTNVTDADVFTPFLEACSRGVANIAELLLTSATSPRSRTITNSRTANGNNALHLLMMYCTKSLSSDGARRIISLLDKEELLLHLRQRNHENLTPLDILSNHDSLKQDVVRAMSQSFGLAIGALPQDDPLQSGVGFQIGSDLHIEFYEGEDVDAVPLFFHPVAKYLCLLGDIGVASKQKYFSFVERCTTFFEKVFIVTGNHEYYAKEGSGDTMASVDAAIAKFCSEHDNIEFLNERSVIVEGVRVIGCTLWSHIPLEFHDEVWMRLNDFRRVMVDENTALDPLRFNELHSRQRTFVEKEIAAARETGQRCIVLSHHAPLIDCGTSRPAEYGTPTGHCFCTDLSDLMGSPVDAWAYGHTHFRHDMTVKGTRIVSNPRGYKHGDTDTPWDNSCVVYVDAGQGDSNKAEAEV